jgi:hypothetical protein
MANTLQILNCGVSRIDITPPVGLELSGGAFGPSKGILHPLSAKALYFESQDKRLLLISADLVGWDTAYADQIRNNLSHKYGIPLNAIFLAATHTHAGPATVHFRNWGEVNDAYCRELETKLEKLIAEAIHSKVPARIGAGYISCPGIAANRVTDDGPVDNQLGVVRIENMQKEPLAVLLNYACHPVNLHSYNGMISPDFPYYTEVKIWESLGKKVHVFHLTGASGDLNPKNFVFLKPTEESACETGNKLAEKTLELLPSLSMEDKISLNYETIDVDLPLQPLPEKDALTTLIEQTKKELNKYLGKDHSDWDYCFNQSQLEWAMEALKIVESHTPQKEVETISLYALRIGPLAFIGIPGEYFTEFGMQIKSSSPFRFTAVMTLTNGYIGYLPNRHAYEIGHYEASQCPKYCGVYFYQPNVGEVVCEAALKLLQNIKSLEM